MQLTATLALALLTLTPLVSACLEFTGTMHSKLPRKITGSLIDNGVEVCKLDKFIDHQPPNAWIQFTCIPGHAAYILTDGSKMEYLYGNQAYEFGVNEGNGGKWIPKVGRESRDLWAKNYGC